MSRYVDVVKEDKKYVANVVIQIGANYFSIRNPDSGLSVASPYDKAVSSLLLNPTSIDVRRVTTTIASNTFKLLDKNGIISALVLGDARGLNGQAVRIFLGRSYVNMDFADYYELPITYVNKCEHSDNSYSFVSTEQTERLGKPIYSHKSALDVDVFINTTVFRMRDDISGFPSAGFLKLEDEFVSYTGIDIPNNRFTGVIRGELNSIPVEHTANTDCVQVETITDNPLNILLKILISGGGGGVYDTLQSGLGIDHNLIDIAGITAIRDELFNGVKFKLTIYDVSSALTFVENEILMPNGLRFTNSLTSKLTVAVLDKAQFVEEDDILNHDTITKFPKWSFDGQKVTNQIQVEWDFNEGTGMFQKRSSYSDADSITAYGAQTPLKFQFKGPKVTFNGAEIVDDFGIRLVARLALPTAEIAVNTQMDKSLQTIGDKAYLISDRIPASDGTLDFASDLEIISRSINWNNGDVVLKLAFTSFTNIRSGYIAPSDLIKSFGDQKSVNVVVGRSAYYKVGWYMRLWDEVNQVYMPDPPNKIIGIGIDKTGLLTEAGDFITTEDGDHLLQENLSNEDTIFFEDDWITPLSSPNFYRIRFADYDDVADSQKRYCFLSDMGSNFDDGKPTYKVTY